MPIISMFYGIIIRLYLLDRQHHNLPHIHAKYAEYEASVGLADGESWQENSRANCFGWFKLGLNSTEMNLLLIGN